MPDLPTPVVSVVITTRGRHEELRTALRSCFDQTGIEFEVLVYDDGSSDGTAAMVRTEFPAVRLFSDSVSVGYIVLRNRGFKDASGTFVVSIDDDAWFTDSNTLSKAVEEFSKFPEAAALALRYTEPNRKEIQGFMAELPTGTRLSCYIGCAHIIRREIAIRLGGYREFLIHQGEERDLCIRLIEHGWVIVYAKTPAIVHDPSPKRDFNRLAYLGVRSTLLFNLLNVPFPIVLYRMPLDLLQMFAHRLSVRQIPRRCFYITKAVLSILPFLAQRSPVSKTSYQTYRSLPKHGAVRNDFGVASLRDDESTSCLSGNSSK